MALAAPCCSKALADATTRWPQRSRASDGILGDAAHQRRKSDHNQGNAFDLTHDPLHGVDCGSLSRLAINDRRVTYVIWNRQIYSRARASEGWRSYHGPNPHTSHMHVSIRSDARNNLAPWPWSGRGPIDTGEWFTMATAADLERVVRKVLNEGTAFGQKSWAGTSKATLSTSQGIVNILRQQVIPRLPNPPAAVAGTLGDEAETGAGDPPADGQEADDATEEFEPIEDAIPADALLALEELCRTLTAEQATALSALFVAIRDQLEVSGAAE
jgi:hypothetical protein